MVKDVDIGREIETQINRLNINKSEFSRRVACVDTDVSRGYNEAYTPHRKREGSAVEHSLYCYLSPTLWFGFYSNFVAEGFKYHSQQSDGW